jgi:hypothetical protein
MQQYNSSCWPTAKQETIQWPLLGNKSEQWRSNEWCLPAICAEMLQVEKMYLDSSSIFEETTIFNGIERFSLTVLTLEKAL